MGRRGPKAASAAVNKAKGNPGRRPIDVAKKPPVSSSKVGADGAGKIQSGGVEGARGKSGVHGIASPPWLSVEGRKIWNAIAPNLVQLNIMQKIDGHTFGRYCENFALWLEAKREIRTAGAWYSSSSPHGDYRRVHPAFMIADRLDRSLRQEEANFGINPADRQKLFLARSDKPLGDLFGDQTPQAKSDDQPTDAPPSAVGYALH